MGLLLPEDQLPKQETECFLIQTIQHKGQQIIIPLKISKCFTFIISFYPHNNSMKQIAQVIIIIVYGANKDMGKPLETSEVTP